MSMANKRWLIVDWPSREWSDGVGLGAAVRTHCKPFYTWHFIRRHRTFPSTYPPRTCPPLFSHGVGHVPFHHHLPPIYNIKRSTVNVYKINRCRSVRVRSMGSTSFQKSIRLVGRLGLGPRVTGRLGSGVWVSASFQILALTAGGSVL